MCLNNDINRNSEWPFLLYVSVQIYQPLVQQTSPTSPDTQFLHLGREFEL